MLYLFMFLSLFSRIAIKGGVIAVSIKWNCNLDRDFQTYCLPLYAFRILDDFGWNFRHAKYHEENRRSLYKMYGIKVRMMIQYRQPSLCAIWIFFENSHKVKFAQSETNLNFFYTLVGNLDLVFIDLKNQLYIIIPQNYCPNIQNQHFCNNFFKIMHEKSAQSEEKGEISTM